MTQMAPGLGSPNDHPEYFPKVPFEPDQGTGDNEKPEEELKGVPAEKPADGATRLGDQPPEE